MSPGAIARLSREAAAGGAADFLVVPAAHTFIMSRADVAEQVVCFLREGRVRHEGAG